MTLYDIIINKLKKNNFNNCKKDLIKFINEQFLFPKYLQSNNKYCRIIFVKIHEKLHDNEQIISMWHTIIYFLFNQKTCNKFNFPHLKLLNLNFKLKL